MRKLFEYSSIVSMAVSAAFMAIAIASVQPELRSLVASEGRSVASPPHIAEPEVTGSIPPNRATGKHAGRAHVIPIPRPRPVSAPPRETSEPPAISLNIATVPTDLDAAQIGNQLARLSIGVTALSCVLSTLFGLLSVLMTYLATRCRQRWEAHDRASRIRKATQRRVARECATSQLRPQIVAVSREIITDGTTGV